MRVSVSLVLAGLLIGAGNVATAKAPKGAGHIMDHSPLEMPAGQAVSPGRESHHRQPQQSRASGLDGQRPRVARHPDVEYPASTAGAPSLQRIAPAVIANRRRSGRGFQRKLPQPLEFVALGRGLLELQILRVLEHLLFQLLDRSGQLIGPHRPVTRRLFGRLQLLAG